MPTLKEIREKAGELTQAIKQHQERMTSDAENYTADDEAKFDELVTEYNTLRGMTTRLERAAEIASHEDSTNESLLERAGGTAGRLETAKQIEGRAASVEEKRALAFQAWTRTGAGYDITDEQMEACRELGVRPNARDFTFNLRGDYNQVKREYRAAQSTALDPELIPQGFIPELEMAMLEYGDVRGVSTVIRTASGNALPQPTVNDTGNTATLVAENATISETAHTGGSITLNAYKYVSMLLLSHELMTDSAFNHAQVSGRILGERLARGENAAYTTGTGSSQPNGVVTAANVSTTAASATAIAADELFDFVHSLDPAYRRRGARWMFHDNVLLAIRKLKDADNQYLFVPGLAAGVADTLLGYPITINQDMSSTIATTDKTMLFGDFGKFLIRDVAEIRLRRLDERWADADQTGFMILHRTDSELLDAGTNPVQCFQQA